MTDIAVARPPDVPAEPHSTPNRGAVLSVHEAAERLRITPSTIYRQLADGTFPVRAFRIGKSWRIDAQAFEAWLTGEA